MTDLRQAAQQALEALELHGKQYPHMVKGYCLDAITAVREALAQPQQEPFGYLWPTGMHPEFRFTQQKRDGVDGMPIYTSPPARKPLTDEQADQIISGLQTCHHQSSKREFLKVWLRDWAAHGIKEQP